MRYNVAQLLKDPIGSQRTVQIATDVCEDEHPAEHAEGSVTMVRTHHGIWVRAGLAIRVCLSCGRCLDQFERTLSIEIDEEYYPEIDLRTGVVSLPPEDYEALMITTDHTLDLGEATRQATLSALPLKPLCRPDCIGICDRCGKNRNQEACDCYNLEIDPRWAALRSLIDPKEI